MNFIEKVQTNAKKKIKTIVFPEAYDPRVLKAANLLLKNNLVTPVLIGNQSKIEKDANESGTSVEGIKVIDPETYTDN